MNKDLIDQFIALQTYYRDQNDKGRSIAYSKAIAALRMIEGKITNVSQIKGIRGIGPKVIAKVKEYLETGKIEAAETAKIETKREVKLSEKDSFLAELETIWGVGPAKAKKLYDAGIRSLDELQKNKHLLTDQQKIGLKYREDLLKKLPRNLITSIYVIMKYFLNKRFGKDNYDIVIAGSYRRGNKESGDIDCLITSTKFTLKEAVDLLKEKKVITDILSVRTEKAMLVAHCPGESDGEGFHFRMDIEFVPEDEWGTSILYFTGSKGFNVYMRADAKRKGMLLNEHGIYDIKTGKKIHSNPTEEQVFQIVGMKYVPPERR